MTTQVRAVTGATSSFARVRSTGAVLERVVLRAQGMASSLSPATPADRAAKSSLATALQRQAAYSDTLADLGDPAETQVSTAQAAVGKAKAAEDAYRRLAGARPELPPMPIARADHLGLVAATRAAGRSREVDLVPLLVGFGPNDPPGEGRCFGPYTPRASVKIFGTVYYDGFVLCGDYGRGDPTRATGSYRFSGYSAPGSRLVRFRAQLVIDELSSSSQRGSSATVTVYYGSTPLCTETVVWNGLRPDHRRLDCPAPSGVGAGFDVRRLRVDQAASVASRTRDFWAGLFRPMVVLRGR